MSPAKQVIADCARWADQLETYGTAEPPEEFLYQGLVLGAKLLVVFVGTLDKIADSVAKPESLISSLFAPTPGPSGTTVPGADGSPVQI